MRTRLELATPGVTGRYSKPTELPHQVFSELPFRDCKGTNNFSICKYPGEFFAKNGTKKWPRRSHYHSIPKGLVGYLGFQFLGKIDEFLDFLLHGSALAQVLGLVDFQHLGGQVGGIAVTEFLDGIYAGGFQEL